MFTYRSKFQVTKGGHFNSNSLEEIIRSTVQDSLQIIENNSEVNGVLNSWAEHIDNDRGFIYLMFSNTYCNKDSFALSCRMYIESEVSLNISDLFTESKDVNMDGVDQIYELSMYDATGSYPVNTLAEWQNKLGSYRFIVAKYWLHKGYTTDEPPFFGVQLYMCRENNGAQPTDLFA